MKLPNVPMPVPVRVRPSWLAALILLSLGGCSARSVPAAPPEPSARPAAEISAEYAPADARFLQQMIPHHAQALTMTEMLPERTENASLRLLAERIAVSQQDEIAQMQRWLREHGAALPDAAADGSEHAGHTMDGEHAMMPGMLTPAQLEQLRAARGAEFDRLFLELMIQHHEGALVMVNELFDTPGGGQSSQMYSIAAEIDADQRGEIERMRRLLSTLPPAPDG